MEDILVQLIPGLLGVLTGIAAWLKGHAEVNQVKKEREETKKDRDDSIQKLSWELARLKDTQLHQDILNEGFRDQLGALNKSITEIKTLVELLVDNRIKNRGC